MILNHPWTGTVNRCQLWMPCHVAPLVSIGNERKVRNILFYHRKLHVKLRLIPKSLYDTLVHSVLPLEVVVQEPFPKNREKGRVHSKLKFWDKHVCHVRKVEFVILW